MKKSIPARIVSFRQDSSSQPRFTNVPTLTEEAHLWKAAQLSAKSATSRSFRPLRAPRKAGQSVFAKAAHSLLVTLGLL